MPRTFLKRNSIAYNETAIKHALHMVETEGSAVPNIYLFCYTAKVHELCLRTWKNFHSLLKDVTQSTPVTVLKMLAWHT